MARAAQRVKEAIRRLFALCVAVLVLATALSSGGTYLWCIQMEQPMRACCCAEEPSRETLAERPVEARRACCESRAIDELQKARAPDPMAKVPPALATLAAAPVAQQSVAQRYRMPPISAPPRARLHRPTRAGPHHASDTCIELQVFRC